MPPLSKLMLLASLAVAHLFTHVQAEVPLRAISFDDKMALIAQSVEGFAGQYIDAEGDLCIRVSDEAVVNSKQQQEHFLKQLALQDKELAAIIKRYTNNIKFIESQYDFDDLKSYYTELLSVIQNSSEITMTDIDERANRLIIGVPSTNAQTSVSVLLENQASPELMKRVAFVVQPRGEFNVSLRDSLVEKIAGTQIRYPLAGPSPSQTASCTIGFMATVNGKKGFITNSHCSDNLAAGSVLSNTPYTQGSADGVAIAQESIDTLSFDQTDPRDLFGSCLPNPNIKCRNSDALFAEFLPGLTGFEFREGFIAKTAEIDTGSLVIDENNPAFRIVDTSSTLLAGQTVLKSGRTTGLTEGEVLRTCVSLTSNSPARDSNGDPLETIRLLCQAVAEYGSAPGDSGSPVFSRVGNSDDVVLHGVHHTDINRLAGQPVDAAAFSTLEQIELDLGITLENLTAPNNADTPNPYQTAKAPGIILDNSILGINEETVEIPVNIKEAGDYQLLLVSSSGFDSRLVEVEIENQQRTNAIDSGKPTTYFFNGLSAGLQTLKITPKSNAVAIRHIQMSKINEQAFLFPENPSSQFLEGNIINGLPQVPGFVYDPFEIDPDNPQPIVIEEGESIDIEIEALESGRYLFFGDNGFISNIDPSKGSSLLEITANQRSVRAGLDPLINEVEAIIELEKGRSTLTLSSLRGRVILDQVFIGSAP